MVDNEKSNDLKDQRRSIPGIFNQPDRSIVKILIRTNSAGETEEDRDEQDEVLASKSPGSEARLSIDEEELNRREVQIQSQSVARDGMADEELLVIDEVEDLQPRGTRIGKGDFSADPDIFLLIGDEPEYPDMSVNSNVPKEAIANHNLLPEQTCNGDSQNNASMETPTEADPDRREEATAQPANDASISVHCSEVQTQTESNSAMDLLVYPTDPASIDWFTKGVNLGLKSSFGQFVPFAGTPPITYTAPTASAVLQPTQIASSVPTPSAPLSPPNPGLIVPSASTPFASSSTPPVASVALPQPFLPFAPSNHSFPLCNTTSSSFAAPSFPTSTTSTANSFQTDFLPAASELVPYLQNPTTSHSTLPPLQNFTIPPHQQSFLTSLQQNGCTPLQLHMHMGGMHTQLDLMWYKGLFAMQEKISVLEKCLNTETVPVPLPTVFPTTGTQQQQQQSQQNNIDHRLDSDTIDVGSQTLPIVPSEAEPVVPHARQQPPVPQVVPGISIEEITPDQNVQTKEVSTTPRRHVDLDDESSGNTSNRRSYDRVSTVKKSGSSGPPAEKERGRRKQPSSDDEEYVPMKKKRTSVGKSKKRAESRELSKSPSKGKKTRGRRPKQSVAPKPSTSSSTPSTEKAARVAKELQIDMLAQAPADERRRKRSARDFSSGRKL